MLSRSKTRVNENVMDIVFRKAGKSRFLENPYNNNDADLLLGPKDGYWATMPQPSNGAGWTSTGYPVTTPVNEVMILVRTANPGKRIVAI
jgi:hypothetical protein